MEETLIRSTVLEKQTRRQILADVFFLRRNHVKTISPIVHAFFKATILVPSTTISNKRVFFSHHNRFTRIPELL